MPLALSISVWTAQHGSDAPSDVPVGGEVTLSDLQQDQLVFDTGAAFGRDAGSVPVSGTATPGARVEARLVRAQDGGAHTAWTGWVAGPDGVWSGEITGSRSPDWLRVEARLAGQPNSRVQGSRRLALGHVIGLMGQSELYQVFNGGQSVAIPMSDPEQVQVVRHSGSNAGGPIAGLVAPERDFIDNMGSIGFLTHGADLFAQNSDDKIMIIQMAVSGTSRWYLADDTDSLPTNRRLWSDHLAMLDAAGWQDGVRPGVIVDMWSAADAEGWGVGFADMAWRFYTGLDPAGAPYPLGTGFDVTDMQGGGSTTMRFDHCLYDLSGGGRGLYDPARTRLVVSNHRHEPSGGPMKNWLGRSDTNLVDYYMWGQRALRRTWRTLLDTPEFQQIATPGPDPLNYVNGSENAGQWTDLLHPDQDGTDGLALFARHLMHAGMVGLGLADAQPEIDQITHVAGPGGYISLGSSAGPVTTTRRLRGEPDLVPGQPYWTDVASLTFNGQPVTRAELQGDGTVRAYPPGGADYVPSEDWFQFGEGGGAGTYDDQADPLNGWWMNIPVIAGADYGLSGIEGVSLRALPDPRHPSYAAAALAHDGVRFTDPDRIDASGGRVTSARFHWRGSLATSTVAGLLFGVGKRMEVAVSRSRVLSLDFWGSGGNARTDHATILPDARHDIVLLVDFGAGTARLYLDPPDPTASDLSGIAPTLTVGTGTLTNFVNADRIELNGNIDLPPQPGELELFRVWLNDLTGTGTPHKTLLGSAGASALDTDPWRVPGGSLG